MLSRTGRPVPIGSEGAIVAVIAVSRFLSLFSVGLGFVVTTWLGAIVGSMQLVGQLFLAGSLTTFAVSAVIGSLADQRSRISLIRWAWAVRLAGIGVFILGVTTRQQPHLWLFAFSVTTALSNALGASAMDGAFQSAIPAERRIQLTMRFEIVRQAGLVCGMGAGGLLLHWLGALPPALLLLAVLLVQIVLFEFWLFRYADDAVTGGQGVLRFWLDGVRSACREPHLLASILAGALLVTVAQLTNLLVPIFVRDTLAGGSDLYGLLESAWSAGGAALLLAVSLGSFLGRERLEFILLVMIGLLMIIFAMSRNLVLLVLVYAMLGGLFALGRAICEGRLLTLVKSQEIGRIRSASVMLNSAAGVLIFLSPGIFPGQNAVVFYCVWGGIVAFAGLVTFVISTRQKVKTISP